ncbi:neuropeptide CCHamide-1 receptor-like [Bacillus rossius redtenbacheri]|uniref:neuropeptide CCHamide-1 receptor-like n=1 Tax=Bacillus rossius redtenbacheri TaxID=93214 RepID=UPI002FDE8A89
MEEIKNLNETIYNDLEEEEYFNETYDNDTSSNLTDMDTSNTYNITDTEFILIAVYNFNTYILYGLIAIGFLGNFSLLVAFCCHRNLRTGVNIYILNMAISDMVFVICLTPITVPEDNIKIQPRVFPENSFCNFVGNVAQAASVYSVAALSVERFLSVRSCARDTLVLPRERRKWCAAVVAAIWVFVAAAKVLFLVFSGDGNLGLAYICIEFTLGYALPLFIIAFFCALTARTLKHISVSVPGESRVKQLAQLRGAIRVVVMLVANYVLCFTLEYVLMLYFIFIDHINMDLLMYITVYSTSVCFRFLHSCINPLVLYCTCSKWRVSINKCFIHKNNQ